MFIGRTMGSMALEKCGGRWLEMGWRLLVAPLSGSTRDQGLSGAVRGGHKREKTTVAAPLALRPADFGERNFSAAGPNQVWVADITYVRPGPDCLCRVRQRCVLPTDCSVAGINIALHRSGFWMRWNKRYGREDALAKTCQGWCITATEVL